MLEQCIDGATSGSGYEWTCEGVNGGADAPCVVGNCGIAQDTCITGTLVDNIPANKWHCLGNHLVASIDADDDRDCVDEVVPAECAYGPDAIGDCVVGDSTGSTSPWMCTGNNPDATNDDRDYVQGVCGTTDDPTPGVGCLAGTHNDVPGDTWECLGNHPIASITADDVMGCTGGCAGEPTATYTLTRSGHSSWAVNVTATDPDTDPLQYRYRSTGLCLYSQPSATNDTGWRVSNTNLLAVAGIGGGGGGPVEVDCGINIEVTDGLCTVTAERIATAICGATDYTCDVGNVYSQQPGPPPTWVCDRDDRFGGVPGVPCTGSVDAVCGTADNAVQGCTDGTWQDETGDGWTCQGVNGGTDASCGGDCMPRAGYGGFYQWVDIDGSLFFTIPHPPQSVLGYNPSGWGVGARCLTEATCIAAQGNWI